ncbi:MAG TPA: hypothetical protein VNA25_01750 [Phycisphaerae bacterium]|nr:hypothetical protein [Phycisphaerae bacterium]
MDASGADLLDGCFDDAVGILGCQGRGYLLPRCVDLLAYDEHFIFLYTRPAPSF